MMKILFLDYSKISPEKFFYDVIYNPSETNFLKSAKKNGNKIENGKKCLFIRHKPLLKFGII